MLQSQPSCSLGTLRGKVLVVNILLEEIRDPQTSYALRDEILSLIGAAEVEHVVIDLKSVKFLGSVGLLAFLAVRRKLQGGSIVLCNVGQSIQAMLEICMLVSKDPAKAAPFELADSVDTAVTRLS